MADINYLKEKFLSDISQASDLEQLNEVKIAALGKKVQYPKSFPNLVRWMLMHEERQVKLLIL